MLHIKSKFINFSSRQGCLYTPTDLQVLARNLITIDTVNILGENQSHGYSTDIAEQIFAKITCSKNDLIVILNDITLELYNKLTDKGYTNIIIAYGKCKYNQWKQLVASNDDTLFNIMSMYIKNNFEEDIKIIKLGDLFGVKYKTSCIIANPPYGKIGATITQKIIDSIDFEEYINLLPANDYKRVNGLWNYQSEMSPINNGFSDAAVTTHLAIIHKNKVNDMTVGEFEISQYIDRSLDKYFEENSRRSHYAIDHGFAANCLKYSNDTTFIIGWRDVNHGRFPYSKTATSYLYNKEKSIDSQTILDTCEKITHGIPTGRVSFDNITFKTNIEKDHLSNLTYSEPGFKFFSKLFKAMNVDGGVFLEKWFPKVDWTRSWTVEEILADYGYTADEIKEVMDDLQNFRGMDND